MTFFPCPRQRVSPEGKAPSVKSSHEKFPRHRNLHELLTPLQRSKVSHPQICIANRIGTLKGKEGISSASGLIGIITSPASLASMEEKTGEQSVITQEHSGTREEGEKVTPRYTLHYLRLSGPTRRNEHEEHSWRERKVKFSISKRSERVFSGQITSRFVHELNL